MKIEVKQFFHQFFVGGEFLRRTFSLELFILQITLAAETIIYLATGSSPKGLNGKPLVVIDPLNLRLNASFCCLIIIIFLQLLFIEQYSRLAFLMNVFFS